MKTAHFCRDGHALIGHNDSEHERCPLCRAIELLDACRGCDLIYDWQPGSRTDRSRVADHVDAFLDEMK
jgi:hypothetical protein